MSDVLLLHAGIADRRMWKPQVEALEAAGHRTVAPDLPGFGEATLEAGVVDYLAFARAQLSGAAAVVGCSFGGRIALELAVAEPDVVERLVLIGAGLGSWDWSDTAQAGFAEEEEALERGELAAAASQQARMWLTPHTDPDVRELTEAMVLRSYEQQLPVEGQVQASWPDVSAESRLGEIDVPTLIVVGTEDLEDITAMAAKLVAEIPGARLATIEGAGHLPSLERPDEVNRLLLEFLR
ncbi:MAG TPA: alpha/beta hydrolase [Gaiellaceae bacterium]|nr:alpha/beta hydrolase [Gaiellaceae bacterium]